MTYWRRRFSTMRAYSAETRLDRLGEVGLAAGARDERLERARDRRWCRGRWRRRARRSRAAPRAGRRTSSRCPVRWRWRSRRGRRSSRPRRAAPPPSAAGRSPRGRRPTTRCRRATVYSSIAFIASERNWVRSCATSGLVGEAQHRQPILLAQRLDERPRRRLDALRRAPHAAALVEGQDDRDRARGFGEGLDGLRDAVLDHHQILACHVEDPPALVDGGQLQRRPDRRRLRARSSPAWCGRRACRSAVTSRIERHDPSTRWLFGV